VFQDGGGTLPRSLAELLVQDRPVLKATSVKLAVSADEVTATAFGADAQLASRAFQTREKDFA
jgi:hypothetical protein